MKRIFDFTAALIGLIGLSPLLLVLCLIVWMQDRHSPFYIATRIGKGGRPYRMYKLRSMIMRADANKVDSTANNDPRITSVGRLIRKCKFDEIPQLWNVLKGDMSLVGPRPNVKRETDLYSAEERRLLSVRPGITDVSSIVFSDEGSILEGKSDPNLAYNQFIRPWKSRLGLLYVDNSNVILDCKLIFLTLLSAVKRNVALQKVSRLVVLIGGGDELAEVASRERPLRASPPPGMKCVVESRSV